MMLSRRSFAAIAASTLAAPVLTRLSFGQETPLAPTAMLRRRFGRSDETVPVIGMGTWQTFDPGTVDESSLAPLREVLKSFHAAGGRVIDSSPMYGKSQAITGKLAGKLGLKDFFFATKVWTTGSDAGRQQMTESLAELGREKIELMQVHNLLDYATHLPLLKEWKAAGKFRYIGVTHYRKTEFEVLEKIVRSGDVDCVQLPYSIASRSAEERLIPAAADSGVAVLVMRPFEGGNLFRALAEKPLPASANGLAESWSQLFLKWIVANPAITAVLPATSKPHHMADNVKAGFGALPDAATRAEWVKALTA